MKRRTDRPGRAPDRQATTEPLALEIEKLVYGGMGLGRHEGKVVFVPFTVPGDLAEVRIVERKKNFSRGEATKILRPGPGRTDPACRYFGRCGGCQWQHLDYALQIEAKRSILEEILHHRLPQTRELSISMRACTRDYGYRSRARIHVQQRGDRRRIGFLHYRSHSVEDIESCPLFRPALNHALAAVRSSLAAAPQESGRTEVDIACTADDGRWAAAEARPDAEASLAECRFAGLETGDEDTLQRDVGGFILHTLPSVFFQANDYMVGELVERVSRLWSQCGSRSALDLYSGVGLFSLPLARRFARVVAVETSPEAAHLCAQNASEAGFANLRTMNADVLPWMEAAGSVAAPEFDLVFLDPPRAGAGPEVMDRLAEWAPETIIYVSCDPQTLARDLAALPQRDYRIDFVEGLDLFPQTYHFETIARVRRR